MTVLNIISAVVFFLFPKCPICWAGYASFFSFLGLDYLKYDPYWKHIILFVFLLGIVFLLYKHYQNKSWINIIFYVTGLSVFFITYYLNFTQKGWLYLVLSLIAISSLNLKKILKQNAFLR